jgi:hypothetical protein
LERKSNGFTRYPSGTVTGRFWLGAEEPAATSTGTTASTAEESANRVRSKKPV